MNLNSRLVHVSLALVAFASGIVHGAPVLDSTFGTQGFTRIAVAAGYEDTATASAIQPDGKIIVAGTSTTNTANYTFVMRFSTAGTPDPTFGSNGSITLPPPPTYVWSTPLQIERQGDASLVVLGIVYNGFTLTRFTAAGVVDTTFGAAGTVVVLDTDAVNGSQADAGVRLATQADGGLLVVTDGVASSGGTSAFTLRFRRFLPTGALDVNYGTNGVAQLANLPSNFEFQSSKLALGDSGGGFTLVANARFQGGTYLMLRVSAQAALDSSFGGIGYVSGLDLGNPTGQPQQLLRAPDGRYLLAGSYTTSTNGPGVAGTWAVDAQGHRSPFGSNGVVPYSTVAGVLPEGDIAFATRANAGSTTASTVTVTRFDAGGNLRVTFGTNGAATVPVSGYQAAMPVSIHGDAAGRVSVVNWANTRTIFSGLQTLPRGNDVFLVGLSANGVARADFGRGDGTATWDNTTLSSDQTDTVLTDANGRIVLAGYTNTNAAFDFLVSRLLPNGQPDTAYGVNGRMTPQSSPRFVGLARAGLQPDGGVVVATGEAVGSFGTVRAVDAFRATPAGALDAAFKPSLVAAGPNATVGLGTRPDGRALYLTSDAPAVQGGSASYVLQQLLPDGSPDASFGISGRVTIAAPQFDNAVQADLRIQADGSVVGAVFAAATVTVFKVAANGALVTSFGTGGVRNVSSPGISYDNGGSPTLLALSDGTLVTAKNAFKGPAAQRLLVMNRLTADGQLFNALERYQNESFVAAALTALPDSSIVIARNHSDGTASLQRLLADNQFDASFGPGSAFTLTGFSAVSALGVDAGGNLIVAGKDAKSGLVARYALGAAATSVQVVEFYNVTLRHYFVTANPAEQNNIDMGGAGPGWQRTGFGFRAWVAEVGVPVGAVPVCRFYGTPGVGPNSHFYTSNAAECTAVRHDPGWTYEGIAFYVVQPVNDHCTGGTEVYRAYNNRFAQNDSNHRYATQLSLLTAMQPLGWTVEGVAFCAAPG